MDDPALERGAAEHGTATGRHPPISGDCVPLGAHGMRRDIAIGVVLAESELPHRRVAQPRGGLAERVEHQLQVEGRAADHLQHVAGRGLVFERLLQITRAVAQLLEQPVIFYCDDRLIGEGLEKPDLPLGERLHPPARQVDDAERLGFAQQRHGKSGAHLTDRDHQGMGIFGIGGEVGDVDSPTFEQSAPGDRAAAGLEGDVAHHCVPFGGKGEGRYHAALAVRNQPHLCTAEPRRRFEQRIENRLQIEGRTADDLQDVANRRLIFERFLQVVAQPRIRHRDRRLRRETPQQHDFPIGEGPHLRAVDEEVAEKRIVLAQRHREQGAGAGVERREAQRIAGTEGLVRSGIGNMDERLAAQQAAMRGVPEDRMPGPRDKFGERRREAAMCRGVNARAVIGPQDAESGVAQGQRLVEHRLEYRREVAGRAVYDLQHPGGGDLPRQRLVAFGGSLLQLALKPRDLRLELGNGSLRVRYRDAWHLASPRRCSAPA